MTEYAGIKGTRVKFLTSDPTLTSDYEGQVWYNSTTGVNKSLVQIKSWSSGGNMPVGRSGVGGCGTQTAALSVGGEDGSTIYGTCFEYNGFSWSDGGTVNDSPTFFCPVVGIQTAAMRAGGFTGPVGTDAQNAVENYDGTSWTTGTDIPTARGLGVIAGTQTAAILAGGSPGVVTDSFLWNGSSWTATNSLIEAKQNAAPAGVSTAMLASGGADGTPGTGGFTDNVQSWDGTNWSAAEDLATARSNIRGWGTNTDAIAAGGRIRSPGISNLCEQYDGSSWSATANLGTAVYLGGTGGGTSGSTLGCYFGGGHPLKATTEEYRSTINTVVKAAWSSGGAIPDSKRDGFVGSIGTLDAGIAFGGEPLNSEAYLYNGTSWTDSGATMGTNVRLGAGMGTQTAAGSAGGNASAGYSQTGVFQNFDGSSWSEAPDMVTGRAGAAGAGTLTAALASSGTSTSNTLVGNTEEYNGSSWSEQNDASTARIYFSGCGTQTAALIFGGSTSSPSPFTPTTNTEEYNGTSWSSGGALITALAVHGASGTQTAALGFGGTPTVAGGAGSGYQNVQAYNGTSWSGTASMANAQNAFRGTGGTLTGTYAAGGYNSSGSNVGTTEEFVDTTETITGSTLTTS